MLNVALFKHYKFVAFVIKWSNSFAAKPNFGKIARKPAITYIYRLKVHTVTIKTCNCPTRFDTTYVSSSGILLKVQFLATASH